VRRRPRPTLRLQLTLLYAAVFAASGAALLAIPLLGVRVTQPAGQPDGAGAAQPEVTHPAFGASALGFAVMVVVSLGLGWLIAGRFLRPLRTITATARDISANDLHRRLGRSGRASEFAELAETLDGLFARLEASFESQRRFVANASHELRTPLAAERTLLQVALADPDATAETLRSACREALTLGQAQERLIASLLTLASGERGVERAGPFDLAVIAGTTIAGVEPEARRREVHIEASLGPAPAAGDPSLVASLVANLIGNAVRHNRTGGRVDVSTGLTDGRAWIAVRNTGPVIEADQTDRLFEPFERLGRPRVGPGDGHGLGLAIVRAIARAHGAALAARPRSGGGLEIEVTFPSASLVPRSDVGS
jgi:signal transduction histidine kinase